MGRISGYCKRLGVAPTARKLNGSGPHYTLPMIYDPSTDTYIPDSLAITEYLERQYPETSRVFPYNTGGLIQAFSNLFLSHVIEARNLLTWNMLRPGSIGYYHDVREKAFGRTMKELVPEDQLPAKLAKLQAILGTVDLLYAKNGGEGPYLMRNIFSLGRYSGRWRAGFLKSFLWEGK